MKREQAMRTGYWRRIAFLSVILAVICITAGTAWAEKSFLWHVSKGSRQAYLLGSIHLARESMYPLASAINKAYDRSEVLVVEADLTPEDQTRLQQRVLTEGMYPEGDSLVNHLSPRTIEKLKQKGYADGPLNRFKPWIAATMIQVMEFKRLGFNEQIGIDQHFLDKARGNKRIHPLEGLDYQFELLQGFTPEEQDLFLYSTLVELENTENFIENLIQAWVKGDTDAFGEILFKAYKDYPELESVADKLIFQRNRTMVDQLDKLMADGRTYFVVVGAGHLIGPKGIAARFKQMGYHVRQQ
jgi:uncharacterized protein YbaP (TraB family)